MIQQNQIFTRENNKSIVYDLFYNETDKKKPLVVFCHGYKGFKDWGAWNLVAREFMKADCFFVKFNFSHNGGSVKHPIDFPDLEAFAENNYTKELDDLKDLINFILGGTNAFSNEIDNKDITLIGHSRGGGIASVLASEDTRVTKLITWASICDFGKRIVTVGGLKQWKESGVKYVLNGRTKQQMPHNYQFYENFKKNQVRLNIKLAIEKLQIPHLIIHAKEDVTVKFNEALSLNEWSPNSELILVSDSNHVFNAKHPWNCEVLPDSLKLVVERSIRYL
jgi:pimeloyl-ACP methyl ester carboxylesterase